MPTPTLAATSTPAPVETAPSATTGIVEGLVTWNGYPFTGTTVKVCTSWLFTCQTAAYSAVSDDQGQYLIADVPPGSYNIITKMPDQTDETRVAQNEPVMVNIVAGQTVHRNVSVVKHDLKLSSAGYGATVTGQTVTLTWRAYPGATKYMVTIGGWYGQNPNTCAWNRNEMVTASQYVLNLSGNHAESKCYWSVQAWGDQDALSVSAPYWFVVTP